MDSFELDAELDATAGAADAEIYEQIFENVIVGICFMRDRTFLRVNRCLEEMLEYAPGELLGQSVRVVYATEEDFLSVGRIFESFPRGNRYLHERALVTKTGQLRWCQISGRYLHPGTPNSASVWVVQDITLRKQAEQQLQRARQRLEQTVARRTVNLRRTNESLRREVELRRESQRAVIESREKYRVLYRSIPVGMIITDPAGTVVDINRAMQSFVGARNLEGFEALAPGISCASLPDGAIMTLNQLIRRLSPIDGRRVERAKIRWQSGDAAPMWFDVTGVRIPVRGFGAAICFDDRTAQQRSQESDYQRRKELARADRVSSMGQIAGALAHELGQPLNACVSYVAGLELRLGAELERQPDAADAFHRLKRHLTQAGDVIRNVRAFIADHRPAEETVDLKTLAHSALELMEIPLRDLGAKTSIEIESPSLEILGSRAELHQVLVNLLTNAVDALHEAGTKAPEIAIRISQTKKHAALIEITDNGPGVPETISDRLFDPYTTTKTGGFGMGLMMCRTIIESHGGSLTYEKRRRTGASFRITLPLAGKKL